MLNSVLERVRAGLDQALAADPRLLVLAVLAFCLAICFDGKAWSAGLSAQGKLMAVDDAIARYTLRSLVNALTPARIGTVTRLALFAKAAGAKAVATVAAAIGAARILILGAMATVGLGSSLLPIPLEALVPLTIGGVVIGFVARRRLCGAQIAPWILASALTRLAAGAVIATAVGVAHPVTAACAMFAAIGPAGTLPLTPGNCGVEAAAVAFALAGRGVPAATGLAAGLTYGLLETLVAISIGSAGAALLVWRGSVARRLLRLDESCHRGGGWVSSAETSRARLAVAPPPIIP